MKKLNLAIIGQGRSGKDIHGVYYRSDKNVYFNVKYVVEADEGRRKISQQIYPGCETLCDYKELFDKTDIDVVVNASYSHQHYPITKDLLEHKFNVLVEKPFGRNRFECEDLIATAKKNGVVLAVFQNSFYAHYYLHAKKLIEEGVLGDIKEIRICFNGYSRRWDWQTLQKMLGGSVYNTGPHPIGLAMGFLDFDKDTQVLYSRLDTAITSGDAEDYAKILMTAPNKPLIDIEISSLDAFTDYKILVQGTRGCLKNSTKDYTYKYWTEAENPAQPLIVESLRDKDNNPLYCEEKLVWHEESGKYDGTAFDAGSQAIYENLYYALTEGRALLLDPAIVTDLIGIIEKVHADNPLPLKY